ncbi:hypothetical protein ACEN33_00705 [Ruoffia sp. FAM 24228]|uniref:hypothetical protein n=1 Tax=Ruoffia sp. FAM 24228 TaxID=3259517 RepID=UPI0038869312
MNINFNKHNIIYFGDNFINAVYLGQQKLFEYVEPTKDIIYEYVGNIGYMGSEVGNVTTYLPEIKSPELIQMIKDRGGPEEIQNMFIDGFEVGSIGYFFNGTDYLRGGSKFFGNNTAIDREYIRAKRYFDNSSYQTKEVAGFIYTITITEASPVTLEIIFK